MTTTPATRPKLVAPDGETPVAPRNLHQRLAAIASEVKVEATGNTGRAAGNQRAISIGDVDQALGPLFIKHGIVSDYQFKDKPESFRLPTRDGEMTMWLVTIQAHVYNADNPEESLVRVLSDIGSNPSAAVSFALKRWMRALFKLVEDDDQPEDGNRQAGVGKPAGSNPKSSAHLTAEQITSLQGLNKQCRAPVPDGIPWDSLVAGRSFEEIQTLLAKRYDAEKRTEA